MARCELGIQLESDREVYSAGDTVRGTVEVRTGGEVPCGGLEVSCLWQTQGKGTPNEGGAVSQRLFEGVWSEGADYRYPFAIELPRGPFSYRGRYLEVGWRVRASADIARVRDRRVERNIVVKDRGDAAPQWALLGARPSLLPLEPEDLSETSAQAPVGPSFVSDNYASRAALFALGFSALAFLLMFGVGACQRVHDGGSVGLDFFDGAMLAAWGMFALVLLPTILAGRLAEKALGPIRLEVEPSKARRGDAVRFRVAMEPRKTVNLKRMVVRLEGRERVTLVKPRAEDSVDYNLVVREKEVEIAPSQKLSHHIPFLAEGEIHVPKNAPASFYANQNTFEWSVVLEIDVARWPKWSQGVPILVHP